MTYIIFIQKQSIKYIQLDIISNDKENNKYHGASKVTENLQCSKLHDTFWFKLNVKDYYIIYAHSKQYSLNRNTIDIPNLSLFGIYELKIHSEISNREK